MLVYDENGKPYTEQEYMERHKDEAYIIVNRPLLYPIACNIYDTPEAYEDEDFMQIMSKSDDNQTKECSVGYVVLSWIKF